ncbi:MAG: DEAD/DEAH box helicase family protein [Verrucomicrobia bacterium]|nr:DEAD/DEAH box helicase family protein [Verrucomicrobiota bacterium]
MKTGNQLRPRFRDKPWQYTYKTSSVGPGGRAVDILHDFYIPVLKLSVSYERVAGYFRSSSLAAASQGFSAFTAASGRMRMIVGADMDPYDVAAILEGDKKRMASMLERELEDIETWPDDVRRGVELLSWIVACGCLEVRVAFRVHAKTGDPLPFESCDDGYVHEKWGIFTDAHGNRIYMSGSLNESKHALLHNAENISLNADWWGETDRERINDATKTFDYFWNDQNPHIKVLPLPEAIRRRLIRIAKFTEHPTEIDGSTASPPAIDPPPAIERFKFALIKDGPKLPGGRYVGMETAPVKPWPHQEVVARRLIRTWPYSYLLCDEVGLGKTIEAGLAIRSLYLSGLVKRVLIAPPASLTQQWHREMASKFFLPFARVKSDGAIKHEYIFPLEESQSGLKMYEPDLCIVSTGLLSRKQRVPEIKAAEPFDIALVDEAHYARRKDAKNGQRSAPKYSHLFIAIRDHLKLKSKSLWLATATPMQLDWIEVFDLIHLTSRIAQFQEDPTITWSYYIILGKLIRNQHIKDHEWEFLRNTLKSVKVYDPLLWSFLENAVIDGRIRPAIKKWFDQGSIPKGRDLQNIQPFVFAAAPLSRVMLRHTRPLLEIYRKKGQLGANLAKRQIQPVPKITLNKQERIAYDNLEFYCRELTKQIETNNKNNKWKVSLGFYLSFLRLRLASSLFALRETLKRRKTRVIDTLEHLEPSKDFDEYMEPRDAVFGDHDDVDEEVIPALLKNRTRADLIWEKNELDKMLTPLEELNDTPCKMEKLLSVLEERRLQGNRIKQTVIFTRFYDTLTDIVNQLRAVDHAMLIGTYSGKGGKYLNPSNNQLLVANRDQIKHRFSRGDIDVLVCTDAAAEGLNLQTADYIINYDLPWNPMKVEQRIGRIDRIGQKHDRVQVLNLCYVDSAEQIVYDRLLNRLAQAIHVVGAQQISMLPVTEDEFSELADDTLKEEVLFKRAKERIKLQKQRTESMEIPAGDLYDIYSKLKQNQDANPSPVTLDDIWTTLVDSEYLRSLGCIVSTDNNVIQIRNFDHVSDKAAITVDQELYEQGATADEYTLHFASYGEPVFENILNAINQFDLPPCVKRISKYESNIGVELIAYAAACISAQGESEIRLITRYSDIQNLVLDEDRTLSDNELSEVHREFEKIKRNEFEATLSIDRLINENERAGKAHAALNLLVADSLFPVFNKNEQDNFRDDIRDKDKLIEERDDLIVSNLPTLELSKIRKYLLFDLSIPKTGDTTNLTLPISIIESAVNTACRLANSLEKKKSDLTIGKVKGRIRKELKDISSYDFS